jgi:hypothetical protein
MTNSMQVWKRVGNTLGSIVLAAVAAVGASLIALGAASAETYPSKPIKFVVPLGAASPTCGSCFVRAGRPASYCR